MKSTKIKEIMEITTGVVFLSLGFYFFLLPQGLVIGGVMGISVLIMDHISVSLFMFIANAMALLLGLIFLGKIFFLKTVYASLLSPIIILILELTVDSRFIMQYMSESPLLVASAFGGIFIGIGLGVVIRNNATTGGMDVIQNIIHKYLHIPFSTAMYAIDGIIILIAIIINVQLGLYAIGALIISGMIIDRLSIEGQSGYTVFIVTSNSQVMKEQIFSKLERGFTKVKVVGGYSNEDRDMIICTVHRSQLYGFKRIIKQTDIHAFTFVTKTKEALGQGFSREAATW